MAEILKPGVLFKKGSISQLQTLINGKKGKDGVFYLAEDEQNLYFGTSTGEIKRIQGNVKFYLSLQDFQNNEQPPYSTDLIYFIADNNALVRWDGAKWVQLNATADSVNSAIADITDAIGALEDSVSANAGNIAQNAADIALKASQADLLALDGEVDALAVRVTNAETTIGQHTTAISKKAEQTALDATNQSVVANAEAIKDLQDNAKELATNKDLTALAERVTTAEGTIADHTTLIGQKADKSVVESISSDLEAAKASIVSNNEKITANTKNINDYKESNNARVLAVENRVATNENDIANLKDTKVNNGDFTNLSTTVEAALVSIKANADAISANSDAIKENSDAIALKANASDLATAVGDISSLEGRMSTAEGNITNLTNNKADKTDLQAAVDSIAVNAGNITNLTNNKADKTTLTSEIARVDGRIDTAVANHSTLNNKVTTIGNTVTDLGNTVSAHTNSIQALDANKVSKVEGYDLIDVDLIDKLESIEDNANRIFVDTAFNKDEKGAAHTLQTGVVSQKFADLDSDIAAYKEATNASIQGLSANKADKTAVDAVDKELRDAITEINNAIGAGTGAGTTLTGRVSALETLTQEQGVAISDNADDIEAIQTTISESLATKAELKTAKDTLEALINSEIDAANAMTYKNAVSAADQLPTTAKIGDTFVVSQAFGSYNAGDLLVANGTEGEDGSISGTITWDHVVTGYSTAFDQTLEVQDGNNAAVINLNTYTGVVGTSVGLASANEGLTIEAKDNVITLNLVWGDFNS